MKRMYSKRAARMAGYQWSMCYHNRHGLGEDNLKAAVQALEANHKEEDFVYVKTDNKMSFFFKESDYSNDKPSSLNNRVDRSVRPFFMGY